MTASVVQAKLCIFLQSIYFNEKCRHLIILTASVACFLFYLFCICDFFIITQVLLKLKLNGRE
ncbi:hypothetical protein DQ812_23520 [Salmonella enterica subsp. enterica]|nr:hypothetical protein [Salmonella enterica subsp. enterica]EBS4937856.1 hypothetical protein [Salmonella enterica subsp. enterica serovar Goverdhan]EBU7062543.1 hypothetical protein [Salmonella enterica subsp. enterica serovar Goverdhan]MLO39775.1 hypothetical protein [Salmonella enterica subsp. enterica serovar Goverdhan]